jgi:hypothetical protein
MRLKNLTPGEALLLAVIVLVGIWVIVVAAVWMLLR